MPLIRDEMGHTNIATTERYCNIPLKRLEDDFPTYAKMAKNGIKDTLSKDTNALEMRSLVEK